MRSQVKWFAKRMEQKLKKNDHKGGWEDMPNVNLVGRLRRETVEMEEELFGLGDRDKEAIINECADIANFAMMIADNINKDVDR